MRIIPETLNTTIRAPPCSQASRKEPGPRSLRFVTVIRDVTDDLEKEFGDNEVTIKINSDDETVEIKASGKKGGLEDRLEELEGTVDTLKSKADTTKGQW